MPELSPTILSNPSLQWRTKSSDDQPTSLDGMLSKKQPSRLSRPSPMAHSSQPTTEKAKLQTSQQRTTTMDVVAPQPFASPAHTKQQRSQVLHRRSVQKQVQSVIQESVVQEAVLQDVGFQDFSQSVPKAKINLLGMAGVLFVFGIAASIMMFRLNGGL